MLLLACGAKDPNKELRERAQSWRATLVLVQQQRANLPQRYAKQVPELAVDELTKELKKNDEKISKQTRDECRDVIALAGRLQ